MARYILDLNLFPSREYLILVYRITVLQTSGFTQSVKNITKEQSMQVVYIMDTDFFSTHHLDLRVPVAWLKDFGN